MKPARFEYFRPSDLAEALSLKASYGGEASVLAGGQSLIPVLNFRLGRPAALIDLGGVKELAGIRITGNRIGVGSMTRQRAVEKDDATFRACPILRHALHNVAHPAIRNRGTIGGTIAHADPAAEIPAVLTALGGDVKAHGEGGVRTIPAGDFFLFPLTNSLEADEIVTEVSFPAPEAGAGASFVEYGRRHGDFALAGVCAVLTATPDGATVTTARIGLCGVAPAPVRAAAVEIALAGGEPGANSWAEAGNLATELVDAEDETQASITYRKHLLRSLVARALEQAWSRIEIAP